MVDDAPDIRLGTRASVLARTQSAQVGDALAAVAGVPWREVLVRTHGDDTRQPLNQPGRPGLFVSALRDALLAGEVDVIVHSYKDLPSAPAPGIVIGAVPARVDRRDALVSRSGGLADLPEGAVVGTSSPRREAALLRIRPDLVIRPIRGNVDTRIAKVRSGEFDATVLAVAGLSRIGRLDEIAEILDDVLPAPAQGALAVECRAGDERMRSWLAHLDDVDARLVTAAEREVLVGISAACTTAIAAGAERTGDRLRLRVELDEEGRHASADIEGPVGDVLAARALGLRAAAALMGAHDARHPVLLVRSDGADPDGAHLADLGIPAISDPYVQITPRHGSGAGRELLARMPMTDGTPLWVLATSPMAVPAWVASAGEAAVMSAVAAARAHGVRAAATGERTAQTLRDIGFVDVLVPDDASASGLLHALADEPAGRAVFPCGNLALRTLPDGLRARGWDVNEAVVYDTQPVDERPASTVLLEAGEVAAIVLRSPSAVQALAAWTDVPAGTAVVCAGETTARAARDAGLPVAAVADSPASRDVARAVADVLGPFS